jgi:hypothetical protein
MQKIMAFFFTAILAVSASAQSLQMDNVNYPGIYCRFNATCQVSPTEQSGSFTPTNVAATCVLESRTFPGASVDTQGDFGYEYQLTINNNGASTTDSNIVTVVSVTLDFASAPNTFAFGGHASNQVWVVTSGGPAGLAPDSVVMDDTNITIAFDPPLSLNTQTDQTTNTLYIGMLAGGPPEITKAILTGWAQDPVNGRVAFKAKVQAQTP